MFLLIQLNKVLFWKRDQRRARGMSLRRAAMYNSPWGFSKKSSISASSKSPSDATTARIATKKSPWISTVLILLVVGTYFSSLSSSSSNEAASSASRLRTTTSTDSKNQHRLVNFRPIHEKCTVWVAQSSLKGLKGYGVFVTRDLEKGEHILGVPDGVSIPIVGYWQRGPGEQKQAKDAWMKVWDNYWWGAGVADHVSYEAGTDVTDYQIAFGALPNHHCLLNQLDYVYPHPPYEDSLADRFRDPSAGAFTYSRGRQFTVKKPVKAGSEILLNYGYCRHGVEGQPEWVDHAFVSSDFSQASSLIWKTLSTDERRGPLEFDHEGKLIPPTNIEALVLDLLPTTLEELDEIGKTVKSQTDLSHYLATHKGMNQHSPEWIEENGMCLENILPLPSSIPLAGQGAFAQYAIRKDEIVIPAPLLQIMDRDALILYDEQTKERVNDQLLLNYCFGHPESTMLLCPNTQAVLINHCSKRTKECGKKGPNAGVRWSRGWDPTSDDWRKMSLEEIAAQPGRGLAFEIFAKRDIAPGEEIFIDYGEDWEHAWLEHIKSWKPPERPSDWVVATEANAHSDIILPDFIAGDLRGEVKHSHLFTACQYHTSGADRRSAYMKSNDGWESLSDDQIMEMYSEDGSRYGYPNDDMGYSKHQDTSHWPCTVLLREANGAYTVRIHQNPWEDDMPWEENDVPRILTGYKRSNIHYFVQPFKSDQHLPGAFRYPLGIPDEMFPEHWKNLKQAHVEANKKSY